MTAGRVIPTLFKTG